jgi:hypothetical protein
MAGPRGRRKILCVSRAPHAACAPLRIALRPRSDSAREGQRQHGRGSAARKQQQNHGKGSRIMERAATGPPGSGSRQGAHAACGARGAHPIFSAWALISASNPARLTWMIPPRGGLGTRVTMVLLLLPVGSSQHPYFAPCTGINLAQGRREA